MPKGHRAGDIDAHLRRAFKEIESDPLPERLLGLLEELRRREGNGDGGAAEDGDDTAMDGTAREQEPDRW